MTEELTYDTIPNEFWPKCSWCGDDLGDFTLVKNDTPFKPLRICDSCRHVVLHMIQDSAPWALGQFLYEAVENNEIKKETLRFTKVKEVHTDDMLTLAIQRMKEAKEV